RRFYTGIYPYTMMTSVFSPTRAADGLPLKVTTSNQEWCGSTFTQANLRGDTYELKGYSYFQNEGDWSDTIKRAVMEDGLWVQLRQNPEELPTGEMPIVPGSHYTGLMHKAYEAVTAKASLSEPKSGTSWSDNPVRTYTVSYPSINRTLAIHFEAAFPYLIVGWEETYSGYGPALTTRATLTHAIMEDYWSHNNNADAPLRSSLGLEH
ncbi:MAG: hypothetical protein AAFX99_08380, partial [Myxococcota bacterium]